MSGAAIDIVAVAKSFAGNVALNPLDLSIPAGDIVVLLGPSGCGKTTLLRLIAGLETPDAGVIRFDGQDVTRVPVEGRKTGMVFQSYALFPNMSVAENVGYGLKVRKMPASQRRTEIANLLDMVGLTELADRRVTKISGGQRQRVALARALAIQPRVLLLDEPLSALDAALRDRLRIEIAALLRRVGITAVYVTHDQAEAMAIGDTIVVMDRGRIAQSGTPQDVYARPANRFVAEFVGTMNRLSGKVIGGVLHAGDIRVSIGGPDRDTTLWFRPEAAMTTGGADTIALAGTVAIATFLGSAYRLSVARPDGANMLIDAPATTTPLIGAPVTVHVPRSALTELPADVC